FKMSWSQFRKDLNGGDLQPPEWELAKVRAGGPAVLVASLLDDDPFKSIATKALSAGRLFKSMDEMTDDELVAICDYRAILRRARRRMELFVTQFSWGPP